MSGISRRTALSLSKDKRILKAQKLIKCPEKPGGAECGESRKLGFEREYQKATSGSTPNEDWQEQFEWMSEWRIRKAMKLLRQAGIVKVVRYMAVEWDQTNYYTIDYARLEEFLEKFRKNRKSIKKPQSRFQIGNSIRRAQVARASLDSYHEQFKEKDSENCTIDDEVNTDTTQSDCKEAQMPDTMQTSNSNQQSVDNQNNEPKANSSSSYSTKTTDHKVQSKPIHNPHHHPHMDRDRVIRDREGAGTDRNLDSKGSGDTPRENPKPKLRDVLKRPVKKTHVTKAVRKEANVPLVEPLFNINNLTSINELFDKVVQELVQPQSVPPVPETVEPDVVQDKVQLPQDKPEPKSKPQKTPKGTKPNKKIPENSLYESHEQREAFKRDALAAFNNGVGHARYPMGLFYYIDKEIREGRSHTYFDEWKEGLPIGFGEKQEWEIAPGYPSPLFVQYLQEKLKNNYQSQEQALLAALNLLKDITQAKMFWVRFKEHLERLRDDAEKGESNGVQTNVPTWFMELPEISLERAAESARYLAESAPEQVHWLTRKLGELGDASKILNAYSNPLLPYNSPPQNSVTENSSNAIPSSQPKDAMPQATAKRVANESMLEDSRESYENKPSNQDSNDAQANESMPQVSTEEFYASDSSSQNPSEAIAEVNQQKRSSGQNQSEAIAEVNDSEKAVPQATAKRVAEINDLWDAVSPATAERVAEPNSSEVILESTSDLWEDEAVSSEEEASSIAPQGEAVSSEEEVSRAADGDKAANGLSEEQDPWSVAYTQAQVIFDNIRRQRRMNREADQSEANQPKADQSEADNGDKAVSESEEQDPWSIAYTQAQVIFDNIRRQRRMNREADQSEANQPKADQQETDQSEANQVNGNDPMNFEDSRNLQEYIQEIEERRRNENQSSDPEPDF